MKELKAKIRALEKAAYDPYERIEHPTAEDWKKSYDALKELCELVPEEGIYPNTLGYLCYYGRHTGGRRMYREARAWFEKGAALRNIESTYKLADMLHEGKIPQKDDLEALGYLLEARYAIEWRKQYDFYGDDTVEKNILNLIGECEKPDEETRKRDQFGVRLGRVPSHLMPSDEVRMTVHVDTDDLGTVRLEFRRKRKDGKKPNRILWSVAPAMRCFMTDSVVLYGAEVREIWNKNPGEPIVCDEYTYDEKTDAHLFSLGNELQGKLTGGRYVLPMDEFWITEMRDHPDSGSDICQ